MTFEIRDLRFEHEDAADAGEGHALTGHLRHPLHPADVVAAVTALSAVGARVECSSLDSTPGSDADGDGRVAFKVDCSVGDPPREFAVSAVRCATRIVAGPPPGESRVVDLGDVRLAAGGSVAGRVVDRCIQIFGGLGVSKELPLERWYRELRIKRIGEGPSEVQRMVVARNLLGQRG